MRFGIVDLVGRRESMAAVNGMNDDLSSKINHLSFRTVESF